MCISADVSGLNVPPPVWPLVNDKGVPPLDAARVITAGFPLGFVNVVIIIAVRYVAADPAHINDTVAGARKAIYTVPVWSIAKQ
jgi:hypothetical protein